MIYIILALLFVIFSFLEQIKYTKWFSEVFCVILCVILILFAGLRDGNIVGTDSPAYYSNYIYRNWEVEYGYTLLNNNFSAAGINYNIFLLLLNSLVIYNIFKFIKSSSYYLILPLFVYFSDFYLYYNFSGIRQGIALSFTCLAVTYIIREKKKWAIFMIIVGALFHISCLIFLLALFIPSQKINIRNFLKFILLIVIGGFILNHFIGNIEYLKYKFLFYSELQEKADNIQTAYIIGILKRVIVLLGIFIVRKSFFSEKNRVYLFNLYIIGLIIYMTTYLISPDFGVRLSTYFTMMDCVLIGNILWISQSINQRQTLYFLFIVMILYKIYTYTLVESYDYKFFA